MVSNIFQEHWTKDLKLWNANPCQFWYCSSKLYQVSYRECVQNLGYIIRIFDTLFCKIHPKKISSVDLWPTMKVLEIHSLLKRWILLEYVCVGNKTLFSQHCIGERGEGEKIRKSKISIPCDLGCRFNF